MAKWILLCFLLCLVGSAAGQTVSWENTTGSANDTYDILVDEDFRLDPERCMLFPVNTYVPRYVKKQIQNKVKLMEYHLDFPNYTSNPLLVNMSLNYRPTEWARVTEQHGQTLLALAFNYGIFSLMTLSFGVENVQVGLRDHPPGCVWELEEQEKIEAVMHLLMRDFQNITDISLVEQERICQQVILVENGYARFKDRCCYKDLRTLAQGCTTDIASIWLVLLKIMLTFVRYGILLFGPLWFIGVMETAAKERQPYKVALKEPLKKTIILAKSDTPVTLEYDNVLDFRNVKRFRKLKESVKEIPLGIPTKIKFSQYDILVGYDRLLTENVVPVGLWTQISRSLFFCKIKNVGPFIKCCTRNMFSPYSKLRSRPWIQFWKKVGLILLIFFLPLPMYIRIWVFYKYEWAEVSKRKDAIAKLGAYETYENSLIHYLTPMHGFFIFIYCIYFLTAIILGYMSRESRQGKFKTIIIGSFLDLKKIQCVNVLGLLVGNILWPFSRYGWAGCLVCIIYWPVAIPLSLVVFACYCLPSVYLTIRMMFYSKTGLLQQLKEKKKNETSYRRLINYDESMQLFEASRLLGDGDHPDDTESLSEGEAEAEEEVKDGAGEVELGLIIKKKMSMLPQLTIKADNNKNSIGIREAAEHIGASVLCVITMFSVLLVLSECMGALVEMLVFTTMGIIVNAGQVLKYVTLVLLVILYSYDCFNNVSKKYLKLNKALFGEIKGRIKDLADVTRLPSHLQENSGFKSEELSEQAEGEEPDEISIKKGHWKEWMINDLILFVDNEDTPRIPRELFQNVCEIRVSGAPGPVYQSHIAAFKQFLIILCFLFFVFMVVLSFGAVYKVSSTNQMMATLAGGFMPFILKTFMQPAKPDPEINSVSFKSKLDEIIRRFHQKWRVHDFPFEPWTEEDEEAEREREREKNGEDDSKVDTASIGVQTESEISATLGNHLSALLPKPPTYEKAARLPTTTNNNISPSPHGDSQSSTKDGETTDAGSESSELTKVDYLIYIPEKCTTKWLAEWSDLDEVEGEKEEEEEEEEEEDHNSEHEELKESKDGYNA